ncbi:bifunctional diguanylate cyclase/phosphodiesterase [Idiomarina piscisalsi]|nr:bifunctional diguanylate cyclase/phosphodiesterase [Idiomarina piscisalsi]
MGFLNRFFLFYKEGNSDSNVPYWRVSALRIILFSGMILCLAVFLNSFSDAVDANLAHILVITSSFLIAMLGLLWLSSGYYRFCAHLLLLTIVGASTACNLFLADPGLAQIGSMLMYACPLIALMLISGRVALFYGVINIIPFLLISNNINLAFFAQPEVQFPNVTWYISGTMFVFFNVCIPLAFGRTIVAAKRLNDQVIQVNEGLKNKNILYRVFFAESRRPKIVADCDGIIIDFNRRAKEVFFLNENLKSSDVSIRELFSELSEESLNSGHQIISHENTYQRVAKLLIPDAQSYVYEFVDCTQEKRLQGHLTELENQNKRLRYIDSQTNLPNKEWFELQCSKLITKSGRDFYVVVAQSESTDYLRLKHGDDVVKQFLVSSYNRLKKNSLNPCLIASISLNQLVFILPGKLSHNLSNILSELKDTLDREYVSQGVRSQQSFKFGVASFPEHSKLSGELVSFANESLKFISNNQVFSLYDAENSEDFVEQHEISILLDEAISQSELDVHFQPKVDSSGKCVGLEALARWNSQLLGHVSPAKFIPIAEKYRMISRLTDLVVQKVCAVIASWREQDMPLPTVAINISFLDFSQPDFISKLVKHLADFSVKPTQIELELTESCLESDVVDSLNIIEELQSWGFKVSVDDFGVGYSSITRLAYYPIKKLKLDRTLIRQIHLSNRQYNLVKGIHRICEELDINCVVEGVEMQEQLNSLVKIGFSEFQGFYFSKPLSKASYEQQLRENNGVFVSSSTPSRL